jgi:hypothetical protein
MMPAVGRGLRYVLSLPERLVRAAAAGAGGTLQETAELLLPRLVRRSRLYEATARNALRVVVELVGGVEREAPPGELEVGEVARRKVAGNVVELGSIAAFGFSPLWLLAAAADVTRGSRVYLDALVEELKRAGAIREDADFASVDELLAAFEGASGTTARLVDMPPLELAALRRSLTELRADASSLPSPRELARAYEGLRREAEAERRSLLEVSTGVGLAFLASARRVGREHLAAPYREDWRPLREEGFAAYARRVARPYGEAMRAHLDRERPTLTDRLLSRLAERRRRRSREPPS